MFVRSNNYLIQTDIATAVIRSISGILREIVIVGVGGQPALCAELTSVPRFVKSPNPHREHLKRLLDDVAVGAGEMTAKVSLCESGKVPYSVDEKLRVFNAVFLFQFSKKRRRWVGSAVVRTSCCTHDFRIEINRRIEPDVAFCGQLHPFFIDRNAIRFGGERLLVRLGEGVAPIADRWMAAVDAKSVQYVVDFDE